MAGKVKLGLTLLRASGLLGIASASVEAGVGPMWQV